MKKSNLWAMIILLAVALAASIFRTATAAPGQINSLAAVAAADEGKTWAAVYEENKIVFYLLSANGVRQDSFSVSRKSGEYKVQIGYMTADAQGSVYFIKHYTGATDGKYAEKQELAIYTPGLLPVGRLKTIRLDGSEDSDDTRYAHIHVSTSVILTGVSADSGTIVRKAYDADSLKGSGAATVKNLRTYPAAPDEGVYKAVAAGADVAYISKTGKVYLCEEDVQYPTQLYPEADAQLSYYASFIHESAPGQVIVGEQKSGNILRIYTADGKVEYLAEGGRAFGTLTYTGKDVLEMSFHSENEASWSAVAQNKSTGASELVISDNGDISLVAAIKSGPLRVMLKVLINTALYLAALLAAIGAGFSIRRLVTGSRMIFIKLIFVSIPLLVLALVIFGAYSYASYQSSLRGTYQTKVADQGNLLRALFGSASFDKITAPAMYHSVEYNYLRAQMDTRDVYTTSAYFVDGDLYTGVDSNLPCLYPFGVRQSAGARDIYRKAALTGTQQAGVISDCYGERIVCVTPVGSSSGNTVFLLETGVFRAEIDRQTAGFLRNYLIISGLCLISSCILLFIAFLRILKPLGGIVEGLSQFSRGNRKVRLESKTNDELADIAKVFNKMAKDIDVQIYNLRTMGETYYRFVPQQVFRLLGKENLADVELGSAVEGRYCVLVANLYLRQGHMDFDSVRELTNRFFAIVHRVAEDNGAMLLPDSAGLRDLRLICQSGGAAVQSAMDAIAAIDGHNAKSPISQRLEASFFLHHTGMSFGICGDGGRYVPAMISSELDDMLIRYEDFRRLSSRLIVTQAAYEAIDADKYFHRFIGYAGDEEDKGNGLYDFYDSSSPNLIRLIDDTLGVFNKAMELYEQKRYYDAKNMFAVVLRENQYDNVARHYIFQCERRTSGQRDAAPESRAVSSSID